MTLGDTFELDLSKLLFNNTTLALVGDATGIVGSTSAGSLYMALHTAYPGEAGNQTTSECAYTSYARVAVARTSGGFTASANPAVNAALIQFVAATGGSETATHWSIGTASSGTGKILASGPLTTSGAAPQVFTALTTDVVTAPGHGFSVSDRVQFFSILGVALPTGITAGVNYFIKTVPDANTFTISATDGGATLDITAVGAGICIKTTVLAISVNVRPEFAAGVWKMYVE